MSLNNQTWTIASVFTELNTCAQPRFIGIDIEEDSSAFPIDTYERTYEIDLSTFLDQKKIDMIQGIVIQLFYVDNLYFSGAIPFEKYNVMLTQDNGFATSLPTDGFDFLGGIEHHRPLFASNQGKMKLVINAEQGGVGTGLNGFRCKIFLTNFRVRPFTTEIDRFQGA